MRTHQKTKPAKAATKRSATASSDPVELQLRRILVALTAFDDGDFSVRLPSDWAGTQGRIAEAFNQTIGNAERITLEAFRVSAAVGKEGRLAPRMSAPGASGGWVELLNTLMDDLVRLTNDIARTIGAVAKGDLGQSMELQVDAAPQLRILIADDNEDSASTLAFLFQAMGHVVSQANDGEAAVAKAAEFGPDLILLDIGMPKLNGYEVCRRIRAQQGGRRPTIVAVTGWGQPNDRRLSHEAGFDKHLVKPLGQAELDELFAAMQG